MPYNDVNLSTFMKTKVKFQTYATSKSNVVFMSRILIYLRTTNVSHFFTTDVIEHFIGCYLIYLIDNILFNVE
jgi:hypothetical protein